MSVDPLASTTAADYIHDRSPDWRFIAALCVVATVFLALVPPIALGSRLEGRLFPIFSYQAVAPASVTRTDGLLCWDWTRDKKRAPPSLDIDVTLETGDGDSYAPEIFDARTGVPWHKGGALPPGSYVSRFCTRLPGTVADTTPVRLRQDLSYEGFLALWTLHVPLPVIISQ